MPPLGMLDLPALGLVLQGKAERREELRYFVVGTLDPQFLHATTQGVGVQIEELGGAFGPFDHPCRLLQHSQDMALFDLSECQSIPRNRARRWTSEVAVAARLARNSTHTLRSRGSGVPRGSRQKGTVQPEDGSRREDHHTLDEVLQLAN